MIHEVMPAQQNDYRMSSTRRVAFCFCWSASGLLPRFVPLLSRYWLAILALISELLSGLAVDFYGSSQYLVTICVTKSIQPAVSFQY